MQLDLAGKHALVTGASMGIGEAVAHALAREGASVVLTALEADLLDTVAGAINDEGGTAFAVAGDLASDDDAAHVAAAALEHAGAIDVLVNNAGILTPGEWLDLDTATWAMVHNVNVLGAVRMIRALVPGMKEAGWGRVINVSSTEAIQPFPYFPHYAATKAALVNMTVSLARALDRTGITVNTVTPGLIHTAGVEGFYRGAAQQFGWGDDWAVIEANAVKTFLDNPTGRFGTVDEVADLVAFLASPRAGFVNGADLRIDGGSTVSVN
jgi:NAD(P)-dependent dehydrogenase (short-subunit alcohol dehydrogenase family)